MPTVVPLATVAYRIAGSLCHWRQTCAYSGAHISAHELLKLPAAKKLIDPFASILGEKATVREQEQVKQPSSNPERGKKQVTTRRTRHRINSHYDEPVRHASKQRIKS